MIAVTGGAGFIGSNLIKGLNARGHDAILVVDDPAGNAGASLSGCGISDCVDKDDFRARLRREDPALRELTAIFHEGACTDTLERDERFMLENNYRYSVDLLEYCQARGLPFIYASSAAVYGTGTEFVESPRCEHPINVYGLSKKLFDDHVREVMPASASQIVGLRYFNVYGPGEQHKGAMASVACHFNLQARNNGRVKLFKGSGGYGDGEQRRDFVFVDDVVSVNLWFLSRPHQSGIFNVGTGQSRSFNDVARAIIAWHGTGVIEYVEFPKELSTAYQSFTQADMGALRRAGYTAGFVPLEDGVRRYLDWLNANLAPAT